jgi:hypothetical protein
MAHCATINTKCNTGRVIKHTVQNGTDTVQHSTAEHTKKRGTPHCTKRRSTQYSTAQHTVHYGTALTWIPCTASLLCTRMIFGGTSRTPNSNAQERRERVRERRSTLAVTLLCQGFEYWNMCVHLSWSKLVIEHVCMCVCMHMCSCVWRFCHQIH